MRTPQGARLALAHQAWVDKGALFPGAARSDLERNDSVKTGETIIPAVELLCLVRGFASSRQGAEAGPLRLSREHYHHITTEQMVRGSKQIRNEGPESPANIHPKSNARVSISRLELPGPYASIRCFTARNKRSRRFQNSQLPHRANNMFVFLYTQSGEQHLSAR